MSKPWTFSRGARIRRRVRVDGVAGTARAGVGTVGRSLASRAKLLRPSLSELSATASAVHRSARDMLRAEWGMNEQDVSRLSAEFDGVAETLGRLEEASQLHFPPEWAQQRDAGLLLYALVRSRRPMVVLETGVADGHSSYVILSALEQNGAGALTSVEVRAGVGAVVPASLRARWAVELLSPQRPKQDFMRIVDGLAPIDLFHHDSDHRYSWQVFEMVRALSGMRRGAPLIVDDVDASYALIDVARHNGVRPALLLQPTNVVGSLVAPGR